MDLVTQVIERRSMNLWEDETARAKEGLREGAGLARQPPIRPARNTPRAHKRPRSTIAQESRRSGLVDENNQNVAETGNKLNEQDTRHEDGLGFMGARRKEGQH